MIWLTGCNGMLGSELAFQMTEKDIPFIGTGRDIDITDTNAVSGFMKKHPDINMIINCAAYTNVDEMESNQDAAYAINALGPENLARACHDAGARLIHFSTDYVFDGKSSIPYKEEIDVHPLSVYGNTKALGEKKVLNVLKDDACIIRTSWLYGKKGNNFVYKILTMLNEKDEIAVVDDQTGGPTYAKDLAEIILLMIKKENGEHKDFLSGIYHFSNRGTATWYEFANEIKKLAVKRGLTDGKCSIKPCKSVDFLQKAQRPSFSVLNTEKISQSFGFKPRSWRLSLSLFFDECF